MIRLSFVSIFLAANCLSRVTACNSKAGITVTPVDGTHLSIDYHMLNITDYTIVKDVEIKIDVSYTEILIQ